MHGSVSAFTHHDQKARGQHFLTSDPLHWLSRGMCAQWPGCAPWPQGRTVLHSVVVKRMGFEWDKLSVRPALPHFHFWPSPSIWLPEFHFVSERLSFFPHWVAINIKHGSEGIPECPLPLRVPLQAPLPWLSGWQWISLSGLPGGNGMSPTTDITTTFSPLWLPSLFFQSSALCPLLCLCLEALCLSVFIQSILPQLSAHLILGGGQKLRLWRQHIRLKTQTPPLMICGTLPT